MKYDFVTQVDRSKMASTKWESMIEKNPDLPKDIVPLSVADMEYKMCPEIVDGLKEQIENAIYGYTSPTDDYYNAVINWQKKYHNYDIQKEWIVRTPGVVVGVKYLVRTMTKPKDKVIMFTPIYYPFTACITENGCEKVDCELIYKDGKYTIDFEDFEKKTSDPKVTCMILCSPHNPVGRVWTKEELCKIGDICVKNNVQIISDEIHNDLIMPEYQHYVLPTLKPEFEKFPVCTSCSKTFNLAGLKVSNIIVKDDELRKKYLTELGHGGIHGLTMFSYTACELAYTKGEEWYKECIEAIKENRDYLKDFVEKNMPKLKVVPLEGTYLQWLDCTALGLTAEQLQEKMVKHYLYLDEGYMFGEGGKGFERINLACPKETLAKALNRLLDLYKEIISE